MLKNRILLNFQIKGFLCLFCVFPYLGIWKLEGKKYYLFKKYFIMKWNILVLSICVNQLLRKVYYIIVIFKIFLLKTLG